MGVLAYFAFSAPAIASPHLLNVSTGPRLISWSYKVSHFNSLYYISSGEPFVALGPDRIRSH